MDTAIKIESKYFTKLMGSPQTRNMIRTLFINKQAAEKGEQRPEGVPPSEIKKVGVLGAGMMGAGIAYVTAKGGAEVVLLDREQEYAEKGKGYSQKIVEKGVSRGKVSKEKGEALLARITPTTDYNALKDVDLIIEAVFEDPEIKADVIKRTEAVIGQDVIFASNTSTLPITGLAKHSERPDQFIGIHFFSPVDKMPLVEIIPGEASGDRVARDGARLCAFDQEDADCRQRHARLLHQPRRAALSSAKSMLLVTGRHQTGADRKRSEVPRHAGGPARAMR